MNPTIRTIVLFTGAVFFGGCPNMATLQTARTLSPGEHSQIIGGGYVKIPKTIGSIGIGAPYSQYGYRYGFMDKLDAGITISVPGLLMVDGKYQFLDTNGIALATGLKLGGIQSSSGSGSNKSSTLILDTAVPLYASYDVGQYLTVYLSPKYLLRIENSDTTTTSHFASGSAGIRLGNTYGVFVEGTLARDLGHKYSIIQTDVAFFFESGEGREAAKRSSPAGASYTEPESDDPPQDVIDL